MATAKFRRDAEEEMFPSQGGLRMPVNQSGQRIPINFDTNVSGFRGQVPPGQDPSQSLGAPISTTAGSYPERYLDMSGIRMPINQAGQRIPTPSQPGSGTGFRIERVEGLNPILTNVANPVNAAVLESNSIDGQPVSGGYLQDLGMRRVTGTLANGTEYTYFADTQAEAQAERELRPASGGTGATQGFRPARAGQRVYVPTYNAVYGTVAQQRQADINQQTADAATTNAGIAGLRARADLVKLTRDLGINLEPVFEETPIDPANPLLGTTRTITGFASKGGDSPVYIPQGALSEYRAARAAATTPEELQAVDDEFRGYYGLGR